MKKYNILHSDGTVCELCKSLAEVRKLYTLSPKQKKSYCYYDQWYVCTNNLCTRSVFFKEEHKRYNKTVKGEWLKTKRAQQDLDKEFFQRIM